MKSWMSLAVACSLACLLPIAGQAQTGSDPTLGLWKLNASKSKFDPGPAPATQSRLYVATPDGGMKVTIQTTLANGQTQTRTATYKKDGKPYPVRGTPNYDALTVSMTGPLRAQTGLLRSGKVIGQLISVVSEDHKVMTTTYTFTIPTGQAEHDVLVYDRQ
jgi:hypothetical protein